MVAQVRGRRALATSSSSLNSFSRRSGDLRAYSPSSFIDSCAKLGLPNAVRQQNDASEFCGMLMGAIETQFKSRSELRSLQVQNCRVGSDYLCSLFTGGRL